MRLIAASVSLFAILQLCPPLAVEVANLPSQTEAATINKTQPIPVEVTRDLQLEAAILKTYPDYKEYAIKNGDNAQYYYNKVNLDSTHKFEVIVYLIGSYFCGTGGCTTLIFQNTGREYRLVSTIYVSRPPIVVTNEETFGWNNIIVSASGNNRDSAPHYYLLRFDGRTYPEDPKQGTELPVNATITGKSLMVDTSSNPGLSISP